MCKRFQDLQISSSGPVLWKGNVEGVARHKYFQSGVGRGEGSANIQMKLQQVIMMVLEFIQHLLLEMLGIRKTERFDCGFWKNIKGSWIGRMQTQGVGSMQAPHPPTPVHPHPFPRSMFCNIVLDWRGLQISNACTQVQYMLFFWFNTGTSWTWSLVIFKNRPNCPVSTADIPTVVSLLTPIHFLCASEEVTCVLRMSFGFLN